MLGPYRQGMDGGVIVAGGYSTRFGEGDKALAELDGTPMVRHVADRLAPAIDTLVINGRFEQLDSLAAAMDGYPLDVAYAPDEEPGRGPTSGIAAGLAALPSDTDLGVVVACDMPFVDPAVVGSLLERAATTAADAMVPRSADGWYQVLHAVYVPDPMITACRRALIDGERKVLAPLDHLDVEVVEAADVPGLEQSVENVNTRTELDRVRRRLADSS